MGKVGKFGTSRVGGAENSKRRGFRVCGRQPTRGCQRAEVVVVVVAAADEERGVWRAATAIASAG